MAGKSPYTPAQTADMAERIRIMQPSLTMRQIAARLHVSVPTVRRIMRGAGIPLTGPRSPLWRADRPRRVSNPLGWCNLPPLAEELPDWAE